MTHNRKWRQETKSPGGCGGLSRPSLITTVCDSNLEEKLLARELIDGHINVSVITGRELLWGDTTVRCHSSWQLYIMIRGWRKRIFHWIYVSEICFCMWINNPVAILAYGCGLKYVYHLLIDMRFLLLLIQCLICKSHIHKHMNYIWISGTDPLTFAFKIYISEPHCSLSWENNIYEQWLPWAVVMRQSDDTGC